MVTETRATSHANARSSSTSEPFFPVAACGGIPRCRTGDGLQVHMVDDAILTMAGEPRSLMVYDVASAYPSVTHYDVKAAMVEGRRMSDTILLPHNIIGCCRRLRACDGEVTFWPRAEVPQGNSAAIAAFNNVYEVPVIRYMDDVAKHDWSLLGAPHLVSTMYCSAHTMIVDELAIRAIEKDPMQVDTSTSRTTDALVRRPTVYCFGSHFRSMSVVTSLCWQKGSRRC